MLSPFHLHSSRDCCTARNMTQAHRQCADLTNQLLQGMLSNLKRCTSEEVSALCAPLDSNALFLRDSDCSALLVAILDSYWRHCSNIDCF